MIVLNASSDIQASINIFGGDVQVGPYQIYENGSAPKSVNKMRIKLAQFPLINSAQISSESIIGPGGTPFIKYDKNFISLRENRSFLPEKPTTIVTGCCLFDAHSSALQHPDGSQTQFCLQKNNIHDAGDLMISQKPTPYEVETITRLSSLICEFSTKLTEGSKILIHIPRYEYYTYLFDAFNQGLVTRAQFTNWIYHVDKKADVISNFFSRKFHNLKNLKPEIYNPFDSEQFKLDFFSSGQINDINKYFPAGQNLYFENVASAINHGYAMPILTSNSPNILMVDDYSEFRIFEYAKRLSPEKNISAILSCPQVICDTGHSTDLYQFSGRNPEFYRTIINYYES